MVKTDTGYEVYFAPGRFDKWCVYLTDDANKKTIPLDKDYFQWILDLSKKYGVDQVYSDFLIVYEAADEIFDEDECYRICSEVDKHYEEESICCG